MTSRRMAPKGRPAICLLLLGIQTAAASVLFWTIFPVFQAVMLRAGQAQQLECSFLILIAAATLVLQISYWTRYWQVPLWAPVRSAFLGHILLFLSRISFFFGSALFSAVFFRHVPQLEILPPLEQSIAKAIGFMAILFALFCYSLELERLGRAVERPGAG